MLFYYPSIRERRSQTCIKLMAWYNFIPTWRIFTLPYDIQEILNPEFLCNTTDDFEKASPNLSPTRGEALKPPFPAREGG
ncbi:hypothetical protein PN471_02050 [Aphanizomenon sp. CS-733/32]|uniref:hypothetical protein n=1 Tax=Aphanizomenon sp. CS-733/32 TaxID=3021715 RepID=UPI00232F993A|nr:hypothetical protein [Aphanizomenon sp. CS-733/32]MDB9307453.1 hypothetical protein [Aphanizomenon sp. CS-733/32]